MDAHSSPLEAIRIVTRCTSREQFVAMFARYCSATACFIPSSDTRPIGLAVTFSIRLADGETMLKGQGAVLAAWSDGNHRFRRPGVHLGIHRLDDSCGEMFAQLIEPKSTAVPIPPKTQLQMLLAAQPSVVAELETPTVEMPPLALPEEPRVPPSPFVLPANPMSEMDDDLVSAFVDCHLLAEDAAAASIAADGGGTGSGPTVTAAITFDAATSPIEVPVETLETVPTEIPYDQTVPTPGPIATLLGVAPLKKPQVYAAPQPVITELVDRVATDSASTTVPVRAMQANAASIAAHVPPAVGARHHRPSRPRQRLALAEVHPADGPTLVVVRRSPWRRVMRVLAAPLRRWWLPATVATSLVAIFAVVAIV